MLDSDVKKLIKAAVNETEGLILFSQQTTNRLKLMLNPEDRSRWLIYTAPGGDKTYLPPGGKFGEE